MKESRKQRRLPFAEFWSLRLSLRKRLEFHLLFHHTSLSSPAATSSAYSPLSVSAYPSSLFWTHRRSFARFDRNFRNPFKNNSLQTSLPQPSTSSSSTQWQGVGSILDQCTFPPSPLDSDWTLKTKLFPSRSAPNSPLLYFVFSPVDTDSRILSFWSLVWSQSLDGGLLWSVVSFIDHSISPELKVITLTDPHPCFLSLPPWQKSYSNQNVSIYRRVVKKEEREYEEENSKLGKVNSETDLVSFESWNRSCSTQ